MSKRNLAADVALTKSIHIVHVATRSAQSAATRSLVKIEKGARVHLVESFVTAEGAKTYQTHDSIVIWIGDDAELQHVRLMEDALDAVNITTAIFTVGANAKLNTFNLTHGGALSRYQVQELLGFTNRWDTEDWLGRHQATVQYSLEDLEADRKTLDRLLGPVKP